MADNQELLSQLKKILHWKKSIKEYSRILNCTEEDIRSVLFEIRKKDYPNFSKKVDIEKGVVESVVICDYEPKDYKELAEQERLMCTRGALGFPGPTIDLNTCTVDSLERVT